MRRTEAEGEEVRQRSRGIIHDMKLAGLEQRVPIGSISTKCFGNSIAE